MFSYSLAYTFGCGEFYEGGPRVRRPPVKWLAIAESLRNTNLDSELYCNHVVALRLKTI
jgi:hypothetical protein